MYVDMYYTKLYLRCLIIHECRLFIIPRYVGLIPSINAYIHVMLYTINLLDLMC
jgi:hypothetical protein